METRGYHECPREKNNNNKRKDKIKTYKQKENKNKKNKKHKKRNEQTKHDSNLDQIKTATKIITNTDRIAATGC
jgi:hypothetical protein